MELSIVIPVHNEEKNIHELYSEIRANLPKVKSEIIFVDDGSTDSSLRIIESIAQKDKSVRAIGLMANYGQSVAIRAGLDNSSGSKIIIIDGDGQHDPKYIPLFYKKLGEYDVVCNIRKNKKNGKVSSYFGNFLIKSLFKIKLIDSIGGMKGITRQVKENIYLYGDLHRYLPILATWKGFRVGEQEILLRERKFGRSKYHPSKAFKGFIDLLTVKFFVSYSNRPSHIFGSAGLISLGLGFISFLALAIRKIFFGSAIANNLPLFLTSILLILLGFNFIFFGLMGDMISYQYLSQTNQKNYLIRKIIN